MQRLPISEIARVCHEVNRAYCAATGDTSQKSWDEAAEWQRESTIKGVHFRSQNTDATPEQQHNAWLKDKFAAGWVFGEKKDEQAKTHPCCVLYSQLPLSQRVKDHLFIAVCDSLLPPVPKQD